MRRARHLLRDRSGVTALEFGLTAPIFIVFVFGLIEVALALWTQFGLQYGVEAAARCASITPSTCGTSSQIASYAASNALGLTVPSSTFTVSSASCGNQVQASYTYSFSMPLIGTENLALSAQSCFPPS